MNRNTTEGVDMRTSEDSGAVGALLVPDADLDLADERMQRREELIAQLEVIRQRRRRSRPLAWGQTVRTADSIERRRGMG